MTGSVLISILVTFLVIILVLYLINLLPIDGRAKQIVRIIVIVIGVLSLLEVYRGILILRGIGTSATPPPVDGRKDI